MPHTHPDRLLCVCGEEEGSEEKEEEEGRLGIPWVRASGGAGASPDASACLHCVFFVVCVLWAYGGQPLAGHRARGGKAECVKRLSD